MLLRTSYAMKNNINEDVFTLMIYSLYTSAYVRMCIRQTTSFQINDNPSCRSSILKCNLNKYMQVQGLKNYLKTTKMYIGNEIFSQ